MQILFDINLCKLLFASLTLSTVIFGILINTFESNLPIFLAQVVRYGKFASKEDTFLTKKVEVPKSYFRHFYFTAAFIYYPIALREVISVYIFDNEASEWFKTVLDLSCGYNRMATVSATRVLIAVALIALQVYRRFYDTYFVSVFSKNATINLAHYFIGMVYYPGLMLIILNEAPKFAYSQTGSYTPQLKDIGVTEIFAIILFLWAWYHQHVTTVILANLRKNEKGNVVTQSYKIPRGDWFNYLSSPHSSAEIIMYTALTLLLSNNSGWWYVYGWVLSNQVESILLSHWWYQSNFKEFPKETNALIPFVY